MELLLIRHGQSTANAEGIWQGRLDFPLSETGRVQARAAGRSLRDSLPAALYSSPLSRAMETATLLAEESGYEGEISTKDGLLERGGGRLEGSTWEERDRTMPELMAQFRSVPEEKGWQIVGAETDEDILARFSAAIEDIVADHAHAPRITVVTHGGVMRAYLRHLFGDSVLSGDERTPNTSITRIEWEAGEEPRLVELAGISHLEGLGDMEAGSSPGMPTSE